MQHTHARAPLTLPSDIPVSYRQMHQLLYGRDPQLGPTGNGIVDYLNQLRSGGSRLDLSVEGRIAEVTGVPGRRGVWNGSLPSGMAVRADSNGDGNRNNDFFYPDIVEGFVVATDHANPACNDLLSDIETNGCQTPTECADRCRALNTATYSVFRQAVCVHKRCEEIPVDIGVPPDRECVDEVYFTDDDIYYDGRGALDQFDCNTCIDGDEIVPEAEGGIEYVGEKYQCTGEWEEMQTNQLSFPYGWVWGDEEQSAIELPEICRDRWIIEEYEYPNCTSCGERQQQEIEEGIRSVRADAIEHSNACRCGLDPETGDTNEYCGQEPQFTPIRGIPYTSFFRRYTGNYTRLTTIPDTDERNENTFSVSCYGPYTEFDPRFRQVNDNQRQCIINIDVSNYKITQQAKGLTMSSDMHTTPNPDATTEQRNGGAFDAENSRWFTRLGQAFSLANRPQVGDLGPALLHIDTAQIRAPQQQTGTLATRTKHLRTFDDTGNRMLTTWLQEQRTRAQQLFSPSQLELVLIDPTALGLPTDTDSSRDQTTMERSASINTQVHTGKELLDDVIEKLEEVSLLSLKQEDIPLIIPLGSPVEFRILAEKWCLYWMQKTQTDSCDTASGEVRALIDRFDEYADSIENMRMIRSALVRHIARIIGVQRALVEPIATWLNDNARRYQEFIARRSEVFVLLPEWREVERQLQDFAQRANRPWPMNQRYTMPLEYLLDPWLPSRNVDGSINLAGLPTLPEVTPRHRIVDLSELRLPQATTLTIPRLRPIQIKFDTVRFEPPDPLDPNLRPPSPPPSLPPIEPVLQALRNAEVTLAVQPVQIVSPPPLTPFPPLPSATDIAQARESMQNMNIILSDMRAAYDAMWNSIGPLWPDERDYTQVSADKQEERCQRVGVPPCVFPEMQLYETIQRIGSRQAVLLAQDVFSNGTERTDPTTCPPDDHVCTLLAPVDYTGRSGWQALPPLESTLPTSNMDVLRAVVRGSTLPPSLGGLPFNQLPPYDAIGTELPAALSIPRAINLSPATP